MRGKMKWWNKVKGYGFIVGDDGVDRFVHHTGVEIERAERDRVHGGERVIFDEEVDARGRKAVRVRLDKSTGTIII